MKCEHCGTSYEEGDDFCRMCGSELSNACPHCGTRNKKEAKYLQILWLFFIEKVRKIMNFVRYIIKISWIYGIT